MLRQRGTHRPRCAVKITNGTQRARLATLKPMFIGSGKYLQLLILVDGLAVSSLPRLPAIVRMTQSNPCSRRWRAAFDIFLQHTVNDICVLKRLGDSCLVCRCETASSSLDGELLIRHDHCGLGRAPAFAAVFEIVCSVGEARPVGFC